jgi:hypothetical protein
MGKAPVAHVILATREAEIGSMVVRGQPLQNIEQNGLGV